MPSELNHLGGDSAQPDGQPLPVSERFAAYRRLLASPRDEEVHWWYFGTVIVQIDGLPPMPAISAATLMLYRTETVSADRYAIHWDEVGYFADYVLGTPVQTWLNPITDARVPTPRSFAEGPARYDVSRSPDGVSVTLTQPGATVSSIEVGWQQHGERLWLVQRERKTRGFPEVDGQLPDPDSDSGFDAETQLAFLDDRLGDGSAARGLYRFALAGAPPWMGLDPSLKARASVHGVILKTRPGTQPRADSLAVLKALYPDFFVKQRK